MRILIVEDEKRLSKALAQVLKANHYQTDLAYDGEFGLDCALTGVYDVIVLDIMLPKKDGITLLKEVRYHKVKTPVIMLTAKSENSDVILGLDSGADDYLTKPFSTDVLLARLRALGRRKENVNFEGILSMEDFELHPHTLMICGRSGETVKLTVTECQVLELLIYRKGIISSKEMIIEKVWGYDTTIDEHTVETYISFLRKKLALIKSEVRIKAERGAGYILTESR